MRFQRFSKIFYISNNALLLRKSPQSLRWLQWKLNKKSSSGFVTVLRIQGNKSSPKSSEILTEFFNFYKTLYSASNTSGEKISQFLHKYKFYIWMP